MLGPKSSSSTLANELRVWPVGRPAPTGNSRFFDDSFFLVSEERTGLSTGFGAMHCDAKCPLLQQRRHVTLLLSIIVEGLACGLVFEDFD